MCRAGEGGGHLQTQRNVAPSHANQIQKHENQAEGDENLVHRSGMAQPLDERKIEQRANRRDTQRRQHEGRPIAARDRGRGDPDIGPHHVKRPMGEVDEVQQPENDGQPNRQQEQQHRIL